MDTKPETVNLLAAIQDMKNSAFILGTYDAYIWARKDSESIEDYQKSETYQSALKTRQNPDECKAIVDMWNFAYIDGVLAGGMDVLSKPKVDCIEMVTTDSNFLMKIADICRITGNDVKSLMEKIDVDSRDYLFEYRTASMCEYGRKTLPELGLCRYDIDLGEKEMKFVTALDLNLDAIWNKGYEESEKRGCTRLTSQIRAKQHIEDTLNLLVCIIKDSENNEAAERVVTRILSQEFYASDEQLDKAKKLIENS